MDDTAAKKGKVKPPPPPKPKGLSSRVTVRTTGKVPPPIPSTPPRGSDTLRARNQSKSPDNEAQSNVNKQEEIPSSNGGTTVIGEQAGSPKPRPRPIPKKRTSLMPKKVQNKPSATTKEIKTETLTESVTEEISCVPSDNQDKIKTEGQNVNECSTASSDHNQDISVTNEASIKNTSVTSENCDSTVKETKESELDVTGNKSRNSIHLIASSIADVASKGLHEQLTQKDKPQVRRRKQEEELDVNSDNVANEGNEPESSEKKTSIVFETVRFEDGLMVDASNKRLSRSHSYEKALSECLDMPSQGKAEKTSESDAMLPSGDGDDDDDYQIVEVGRGQTEEALLNDSAEYEEYAAEAGNRNSGDMTNKVPMRRAPEKPKRSFKEEKRIQRIRKSQEMTLERGENLEKTEKVEAKKPNRPAPPPPAKIKQPVVSQEEDLQPRTSLTSSTEESKSPRSQSKKEKKRKSKENRSSGESAGSRTSLYGQIKANLNFGKKDKKKPAIGSTSTFYVVENVCEESSTDILEESEKISKPPPKTEQVPPPLYAAPTKTVTSNADVVKTEEIVEETHKMVTLKDSATLREESHTENRDSSYHEDIDSDQEYIQMNNSLEDVTKHTPVAPPRRKKKVKKNQENEDGDMIDEDYYIIPGAYKNRAEELNEEEIGKAPDKITPPLLQKRTESQVSSTSSEGKQQVSVTQNEVKPSMPVRKDNNDTKASTPTRQDSDKKPIWSATVASLEAGSIHSLNRSNNMRPHSTSSTENEYAVPEEPIVAPPRIDEEYLMTSLSRENMDSLQTESRDDEYITPENSIGYKSGEDSDIYVNEDVSNDQNDTDDMYASVRDTHEVTYDIPRQVLPCLSDDDNHRGNSWEDHDCPSTLTRSNVDHISPRQSSISSSSDSYIYPGPENTTSSQWDDFSSDEDGSSFTATDYVDGDLNRHSKTFSNTSEGLSDSDIDEDNQNKAMGREEKRKVKAFKVAQEIMTTERTFVGALKLLNSDFRSAIDKATENLEHPVIPAASVNQILNYLPQLQNFNEELLRDLEERIRNWEQMPRVADIFIKKGPFLKLYTSYIREFSKMTATLDDCRKKYPEFDTVVKNFESSPKCGKLQVRHHMLKPIQRIPQYRLLLSDYLRYLSDDSIDFKDTQAALVTVGEVADHANQALKYGDSVKKLLTIQDKLIGPFEVVRPGRILIKEGNLNKLSRKEMQPRMFFLFNDVLLYTQHSSRKEGYEIKNNGVMSLECMRVEKPPQEDFQNEFSITSPKRSFTISASTPQERDEWLEILEKSIQESKKKRHSFHIRPSDMPMIFTDETDIDSEPKLGSRAPVWIPDARVSMCMLCSATFSVTFRRHHCRACGKVVCGFCSDYRAELRYLQYKSVRICKACNDHFYAEIDEQMADESASPDSKSPKGGSKASYMGIPWGSFRKKKKARPSVLTEAKANDTEADMSGYLKVWRGKKWKKLWYVLKGKVLYTFKASEDSAAKDSTALLGYEIRPLSTYFEGIEANLVFELIHQGTNPVVFRTESSMSRERWIESIQKATIP